VKFNLLDVEAGSGFHFPPTADFFASVSQEAQEIETPAEVMKTE
jgi:hypothetical protein